MFKSATLSARMLLLALILILIPLSKRYRGHCGIKFKQYRN
jgi:hypothetical protein